jgi:hypothetical protein
MAAHPLNNTMCKIHFHSPIQKYSAKPRTSSFFLRIDEKIIKTAAAAYQGFTDYAKKRYKGAAPATPSSAGRRYLFDGEKLFKKSKQRFLKADTLLFFQQIKGGFNDVFR